MWIKYHKTLKIKIRASKKKKKQLQNQSKTTDNKDDRYNKWCFFRNEIYFDEKKISMDESSCEASQATKSDTPMIWVHFHQWFLPKNRVVCVVDQKIVTHNIMLQWLPVIMCFAKTKQNIIMTNNGSDNDVFFSWVQQQQK